jgi:hypothetical protein
MEHTRYTTNTLTHIRKKEKIHFPSFLLPPVTLSVPTFPFHFLFFLLQTANSITKSNPMRKITHIIKAISWHKQFWVKFWSWSWCSKEGEEYPSHKTCLLRLFEVYLSTYNSISANLGMISLFKNYLELRIYTMGILWLTIISEVIE